MKDDIDRTPRPTMLPLIVKNLPLADLSPFRHFVTWDQEWREGKNGRPGGWTKPPKNPYTGGYANCGDPGDPGSWGTHDDVLDLFERAGFAFARDDPFCFLDVDNGVDPATGTVKPWALAIVRRFPTYWERSPSGTGLKGILRGKPPRNRQPRIGDGKVEIFFAGKFSTLTGQRVEGSAATITDCQAELDAFFAEFCGPAPDHASAHHAPGPLPLCDDDIITRARSARNGTKFERLFDRGDASEYDDDESRADQALVSLLSFWTQDSNQIDRIFRRSALWRPKWADRPDYRQRTIGKALASGQGYMPPATIVIVGLRARTARLRVREMQHA